MVVIKNDTELIDNSKYVTFSTAFKFPYSIAGLTYKSEIRDSQDNLIATFNITQDTVNNIVVLTLTPLQKELITSKKYLFDVVETNVSLVEKVVIKGTYILSRGVTQ